MVDTTVGQCIHVNTHDTFSTTSMPKFFCTQWNVFTGCQNTHRHELNEMVKSYLNSLIRRLFLWIESCKIFCINVIHFVHQIIYFKTTSLNCSNYHLHLWFFKVLYFCSKPILFDSWGCEVRFVRPFESKHFDQTFTHFNEITLTVLMLINTEY